jgi:hypothetical protein
MPVMGRSGYFNFGEEVHLGTSDEDNEWAGMTHDNAG